MSAVRDYLCDTTMGCRHSILIDPADQTPEVAANRAMAAVHAGSRMVLVGGSSDTDMENVHKTVVAIKEALELVTWASSQDSDAETDLQVPVLLFPQGAAALSPAADGITFMMLMNSTDRRFLVGEQLRGAPYLDKFGVDALPTGYLVCHPGGKVGEVGSADLLMPDDVDLVKAYSLTAAMYGFKLLYLEAGSGADKQVNPELIKSARTTDGLTIIVGGGIRTPEQAKLAAESGADWVVTGTLTEDATDLNDLKSKIAAICSALSD